MDYRKGAHTNYRIEYHFVWVTKYRYHVLKGDVALRLRELVRQSCEMMEVHILRGVVSKDHVHLLVSAPPQWSHSEIMRRIKGRRARKLFEEFPRLKKRYWGRHLGRCAFGGERRPRPAVTHRAHSRKDANAPFLAPEGLQPVSPAL